MRLKALKLAGLAAIVAVLFFSCDTGSSSSSDTDTDTDSSVSTAAQSGEVPIDLFKGFSWSAVQDPDGTTDAVDTAQSAALYYDAYFSETSDETFSDACLVYSTIEAEEDGLGTAGTDATVTYTVSLEKILDKIGQSRLTVGNTYYWGVKTLSAKGVELASRKVSVKIMPPRDYGDITLGYDLDGWYLTFNYGSNYDTTVGDLYFSTSGTAAAIATGIDGEEGESATTFKQYLTATQAAALSGGAVYYAAFVAKDKNATTVSTVGETCRIVVPASVSETSRWNFMADTTTPLGAAAVAVPAVTFDLSWNNLVPSGYTATETLQIGTSVASLADSNYAVSANSASVSGLNYGATYYARVNVSAYETGSTSEIVSWSSPVIAFTTPSYTGGTVYTMDSGSEIAAAAVTSAPAEIITTGSTTPYGNPAPSLALASGQTIATTAGAGINTYQNVTFKFDFKVTSRGNTWALYFDDQNNSSQSFLPASYLQTAPSTTANALQSDLHGVVLALKYYADNPALFGAGDPIFGVYGYQKLADNAVDSLVTATAGDDPDADTQQDVKQVSLATIETYNADSSLASSYLGKWVTATITVNLTAKTVVVSLSSGGTAIGSGTLDISAFTADQVEDNSSVLVTGLNRMALSALATFYVDNVSYTINDASYVRSLR